MTAIRVAPGAYVSKAPPWSKKFTKLGRLGFEPGTRPPHLIKYMFKKGEISPIVKECVDAGNRGEALVKCIFSSVGAARAPGGKKKRWKYT
jgi:hypothetical protein